MSSREHASSEGQSNGASLGSAVAVVAALESAMSRAIEVIQALRARERELEQRTSELEGTVRGLSSGDLDPQELLSRLNTIEQENEELRRRIESGRQAVERLLSKVRFLEEQQ